LKLTVLQGAATEVGHVNSNG